MIDVFFCTCPMSSERRLMADKVFKWWSLTEYRVRVLSPEYLECSREDFNRQRRIFADENSTERFYLLSDDDCLPLEGAIVEKGLIELACHPDFAILSAWPDNANIGEWTPQGYQPYRDDTVVEHVSVGGLRFMRKGCLPRWPEAAGKGYDMEQCVALREQRFRVGYLKECRINHLGESRSELW